jgi:hypothetical protein
VSDQQFDIWVRSDKTGALEPYTVQPFPDRAAARRWIRRYIPKAEAVILPVRKTS